MFRDQGGVGDPNDPDAARSGVEEDLVDISPYVALVHGDLGIYKRILAALERRADEDTPWNRLQFVVFVMGLFHLKMACADALWRIFIEPKAARKDTNSLMSFVELLRPGETGKIGSKPKFRQMHEVTLHSGIVLRLDAWREKAREVSGGQWDSLSAMAKSRPTFEQLTQWATELVKTTIVSSDELYNRRQQPSAQRDEQNENIKIMHQYFCLYEEMSWAMNSGDIGRVETLFPPWISLFRACGKLQYATAMIQFMTDVHFRYPEGLK